MPHGIIKWKKFPFPYPANAKCVWFIIVDKSFKVEVNFLAFDTRLEKRQYIKRLKKKSWRPHANFYRTSSLPLKLILTGNKVQNDFITVLI